MTETSNGDSNNRGRRGLFDAADMIRECAAMLEQNEFEPSLFEKAIMELTKYSSTKGSEAARATPSDFPAPAVVKQEDFSNKTYNFVSKIGKTIGVDIAHVAHKNDQEKAATSIKNAHRAKEDLAEVSGAERDTWSTASQGSRDTAAKRTTLQTRPPFQRPVNPNSSLIANGWLEQNRRSKMRTVWKEVLVSLVAGRRPGEETTLWVQRENQNQVTGKSELEALHQIPIRGLKDVKYVDFSSDHRFIIEVFNMTEDYTFRTRSAEAAKNWVATLRMTKELVLEGKSVSGRTVQTVATTESNHNTVLPQQTAVKVASLHEDTSVQTSVNENDSETHEPSLKPPKRKTVSELRAIAHGAGVKTHGMERGELEALVARIEGNTVPSVVPQTRKAPPARKVSNDIPHDEDETSQQDSVESETRKKVEEDAKVRAKLEEEARRKAAMEEEAKRRAVAEEEARKRAAAEEEVRRRAEEEARRRAEEEARRRAAAEEARRRAAEEEARRRAHEEHKRRVAEERRREELLRQQQAQWQKQQQQWQMQEEQRRQYEAAEQRRRQEEAMRQQQQWQQWQQQQQRQQQQQQQPQQQRPPNFAQQQQPHPQFRPQGGQPPPPQVAGFPGQAPPGQHQQNGAGNPGNSAVNQKYAKMANEEEIGRAVIAHIKQNILVQWALQPPSMQVLRPVEILVSTIHTIFPPAGGVPGHDHFKKWKPFAIGDLTENNRPDEDKLKKARRKLFLVLHPDKLPKDLNEEQAFVCKMLWDITSDAWNEYENRKNDLDWLHQ